MAFAHPWLRFPAVKKFGIASSALLAFFKKKGNTLTSFGIPQLLISSIWLPPVLMRNEVLSPGPWRTSFGRKLLGDFDLANPTVNIYDKKAIRTK